jgi:4-hydroxy-tetrahydrodipicolinate reductase
MGSRLVALAGAFRFSISAACARASSAPPARLASPADGAPLAITTLAQAPAGIDVAIDFSSPAGTLECAKWAFSKQIPLLIGTTGLDDATLAFLHAGASQSAILVAPNTSLGVAVLADAVARAARRLGTAFACSIVEAHHDQKKDAPSGTAKRLANAARSGGGQLRDDQIFAIRGGDVVGEHTVRFAGAGEYLEFTHRATSRDLFARGALMTARWLLGRAPGWYSIEDTLASD